MKADGKRGELRGVHVLLILVGFFGVMFAVNGIFLARSISSFPGEVEEKSYLQGVHFNDTLAQREAQKELGWTAQVGMMDSGDAGDRLVARISTHGGAPVDALRVEATYRIAGDAHSDRTLELAQDAPGEYAALLEGPLTGRVEVVLLARRPDAPSDGPVVFEARKTLLRQ